MTRIALLNNIEHKNLKINPARAPELGDNYMCVPTFPREFRALQGLYPIVFGKTKDTGVYTPLVLVGLQEAENLFLSERKWDARYIPLCAECKPFLIGAQSQRGGESQWVIHVDLDSPRLSEEVGVALFKDYGGNSEYLDGVSKSLAAIHEGIEEVQPFISLLCKYELLESFSAESQLKNGQNYRLEGFFTINEERLLNLPADALTHLHNSGYLMDIYMQLASLSQISSLIDRKNSLL